VAVIVHLRTWGTLKVTAVSFGVDRSFPQDGASTAFALGAVSRPTVAINGKTARPGT
jgi:hypothetical protein